MKRRGFLKKLSSCLFHILWSLPLAYPIVSFISFRRSNIRTIFFHPDEQTSRLNFKEGVYLLKNKDGLMALSARCSHLGCIVRFDQNRNEFHCPCHGSIFDISGKPLAGPARKNLSRIPFVKTTSGDIMVKYK